ncbi:MAG TPA: sugar transferase [Allosphingosinicella sp.]|nr:sugar transferase [Allosphingosinicella sp.]
MLKRIFELAVVLPFLPFLLVLLALVAVATRIFIGSPILFRQTRPGLRGRLFTMYKFRTMTDARGADGELLPDADRLVRFGRLLRSTSLDELPSLYNLLRGELALVGPRPLLPDYLPLYSPEQARRHDVRPGITGWAQVNGRNSLSWEDKLALDVWYADHRTLWLDIRILFLTVFRVLRRQGISEEGGATMSRFTGTRP